MGAEGGEVIRWSGYVYIKGGGAYRDSITATFARHAIPTPPKPWPPLRATFPFLLQERTGAPAVNCTPVIRGKMRPFYPRQAERRWMLRSNRSTTPFHPWIEISAFLPRNSSVEILLSKR